MRVIEDLSKHKKRFNAKQTCQQVPRVEDQALDGIYSNMHLAHLSQAPNITSLYQETVLASNKLACIERERGGWGCSKEA